MNTVKVLKEDINKITSEDPDSSPKNQQINDDGSKSFVKVEKNELDISYSKSLLDQVKIGQNKCNDCDKAFKEKHVLKRHLLIHYGEKQFICDVCEKSFMTSTLKRPTKQFYA